MSDDLVEMARLAQHDERMSTGALYGDLADRIEELEAKLAQQDDLVQAAVVAALREAAERMRHAAATEDEFGRIINAAIFDTAVKLILALITDDAQAALDRAIAAAIRKGGE